MSAAVLGLAIVDEAIAAGHEPFLIWSHDEQKWFGPPTSALYFDDIMRAGVYFGEHAETLTRRLAGSAHAKVVPLAEVLRAATDALPIHDVRTVAGYLYQRTGPK